MENLRNTDLISNIPKRGETAGIYSVLRTSGPVACSYPQVQMPGLLSFSYF